MTRLFLYSTLSIVFALTRHSTNAQTLYAEDFDGGSLISKGFTVINADGLIANPALDNLVAGLTLSDTFTNKAWINSISVNGNVCALSTSYYSPIGTSNDWLITPPITLTGNNLKIAWKDIATDAAFPDGYNVLISTSAGNTIGSFNSTPIYSTTGAPAAWTEQQVNLNTYAGQTVTFAFVNNSNNKFLLGIDSIRVSNLALDDVAVSQPRISEYTAIPLEQAGTYFPSIRVTNQGVNNASGVNVSCTVTDFNGNTVYTAAMSGNTSIASGANVLFTDGGSGFSPPAQIGLYTASFQVSINQNDIVPENDTASIQLFISDSLYARDEAVTNSQVEGSLGIGVGGTGILGNNYLINVPAEAVGIQAFFDGNLEIGDTVRGYLYSTINGLPSNVLSTTADFVVTVADTPVIRLDLLFPSQVPLAAGQTYSFMIEEVNSVDNVGLYYSIDVFTPGGTIANINGGAFDDLGNLGFPNPLLVRGVIANTPANAFAGLIDASIANTTVNYCPGGNITLLTDGSEVIPFGESYQWLWTSSSDTIFLSGTGTNYFGDINADLVAAMSTPFAPGSYTVEGIVTSGNSIADTTNNSFTINVLTANDPLCQPTPPPPCPNPINVSASIIGDTCGQNTGSISLTTTGGSGQIFYQWSPGGEQTSSINGLSAGNYSVRITDITGCDTTIGYSVPSENPSISLSTSAIDETVGCDGSASVTVTSGNGPFTYQWSDPNQQTTSTANNLCAGTYTVTVSDGSGCSSSATVVVGGAPSPCPNPINVSASIIGDTCGQNTGSISLTTTGGSGQIFYQWSPGGEQTSSINGLSAGNYSVRITDITGCDTTIGYSVPSENPSFSLSTSSIAESCGCDGSSSVTVNGNGSFTYQWNDPNQQTTSTANNLCAGTYTVTVSDGSGCSSSATVVVGAAPSAVSVSVTSSPQTDATNPDGSASAFASGGTPPYSYLWSNGGTNAIITGLTAGNYSVDVSDANGCDASASVSVLADIDTTTSILTMNWQEVVLSPNPSSGDVQIQWTSQQSILYTITIIDASGRQMMSSQGQSVEGANVVGIATSTLSAGLYQVIIESQDTQVHFSLTINY